MHRRCPEDIKQAQQTIANGKMRREGRSKRSDHVCVCAGVFSCVGPLIFKEIHLGKEILLPPHDIASLPTSLLTCVFVTKSGLIWDSERSYNMLHNLIKVSEVRKLRSINRTLI